MTKESRAFFETVRDYLQIYLPRQRGLSPNTIISYRQAINQYIAFLVDKTGIRYENISFQDWNAGSVNDYLRYLESDRNTSAATRNQRLFALRAFLKYARINDPGLGSLSLEVQSIATAREMKEPVGFLSENAMEALLKQPDIRKKTGIRDMCFLITMYDTAARDCEMLSLRLESLNIDARSPTIRLEGKGNKVRDVPLMSKTVEHLRNYLQIFHPSEFRKKEDYLFFTVSHGERHRMSDDNVARFIDKYAGMAREECGEVPANVTPHMFRHTRAMHLYRNGMPLQLLAEFMGHSSMISTQVYAYADTEMKRKALEKSQSQALYSAAEAPKWQTDEETIRRLYGLM